MPNLQFTAKKPIVHRFKIAFLALLLVSTHTVAQQTISLNQAIGLTLAKHPQLKSYGYQAQAAKRLVQQAGVSTPMMIELDVQDFMGTGSYSGLSSMQTTLGISWLLEKDIIDAKVKVANEQTLISDVSLEIEVLDVAAQTASVFITLLAQQQQLKLAKQAINYGMQTNLASGLKYEYEMYALSLSLDKVVPVSPLKNFNRFIPFTRSLAVHTSGRP
ncbi:MAG: TolC family protein, partial [Psychrosphaera sp.]|nr:TolC family protein [Psychrosphaera sp.]